MCSCEAIDRELTSDESSGLGLYVSQAIGEERIISCPFSLAITPAVATAAITQVCGISAEDLVHDGAPWSERMLAATYVGLHVLHADDAE